MPDSIADQSIYIMQKWLWSCDSSYPECKILDSRPKDGEEPLLPTRVIEVGPAGDRKVRIFVNYGSFGKLAAPSHRWLPRKVTETRSLKKRCKGHDLKVLPKSIQDAIKITRKLNLRHL